MRRKRRRGKGQTCQFCKRILEGTRSPSRVAATKDHYPVPAHQGGRVTVWCCRQCNTIKAGMNADAWHAFMEKNPEWWKEHRYRKHGIVAVDDRVRIAILAMQPPVAGIPIEYEDPIAQAAFAGAYRNHKHLLRVKV